MGKLEYYLIIINIVGFLLYIINMLLYRYTEKGNADVLLTLFSFVGASGGILLAILLLDYKPCKENMMSRVFIACVFVIELIIFLYYKGHHSDTITFAFWDFFAKHKILIIYLGIINFISFAAFAVDKVNAVEHRSRIQIITLLGLAFIGGSLGALLGMYLLHHKIRKDYFTTGIPLIIIMQIVVLFYIMNIG